MMNRYENIDIKEINGKKQYCTAKYHIDIANTDIFIIAKDTDRLDLLAYKYYNDATLWWVIALVNDIKNSIYVPSEIQLRIPSIKNLYSITG